MFIAFDGIDGSGKSTLSNQILEHFHNQKLDASIFDMGNFGFMDDIFAEIKNRKTIVDPRIRELLFYFEGNLFSDYVKAHEKENIITDRYYLSYYAYGPINGIPQTEIVGFIKNMKTPDLYFYIDVKPEVALSRIEKYRKIDPPEIGYINTLSKDEKKNKIAFLKKQKEVYENYKSAIQKHQPKINIIDGNRNNTEVLKDIISIIENFAKKEN